MAQAPNAGVTLGGDVIRPSLITAAQIAALRHGSSVVASEVFDLAAYFGVSSWCLLSDFAPDLEAEIQLLVILRIGRHGGALRGGSRRRTVVMTSTDPAWSVTAFLLGRRPWRCQASG